MKIMHLKTQDLNLTVRRCQPFNRIVTTPQVTSGILAACISCLYSSSVLRNVAFELSVVAKSQILCFFDAGPDI